MKTAEEYLNSKGIYALDTQKRTKEVLSWMDEFAAYKAEQAIQEVLKRAAENAEVKTQLKKRGKWVTVKCEYEFDPTNFEMKNSVNKRSILNTEYKDLLK